MTSTNASEAAKAVVRRNTEEVQGGGNFALFDALFADDFVDHTPQPGRTPDKAGARELYKVLRAAFPDFHAEIHWQLADGDRVTTYKTYHGTHLGEFFGVEPTGQKIQFETVDVMRVRNGQIAEHLASDAGLRLLLRVGHKGIGKIGTAALSGRPTWTAARPSDFTYDGMNAWEA